MKNAALTSADEELHPFQDEKHWQESWYFNWSDPVHDLFGLARIGYNFKDRKIDGLVLTIRKGQPEYLYPAVGVPFRGDWKELSAAGGLKIKNLIFKLEEPFKKWRLILTGRNPMDITWTAFTPVYDYQTGGGELPPNVSGRHFEQAGIVTGWTDFKGQKIKLNGTGQRDKSWGVRDWAGVEGWNWISAQFGEELTLNIWEGFFNGRQYQNGFVSHGGKNYPVTEFKINYTWGKREHEPGDTKLEIKYAPGKKISVTAKAKGHFPLAKKGLWIQETSADFITEFNNIKLTGHGVIEHTFHAGVFGIIKRLPVIAQTMAKVLAS